ncbi:nicotinate-nucleotide adenylyltransferase [Methylosinus sp. Ce-a6]|uniref:nicotinate-nucleotide adenylyltransferase n=1 Tax=Methylosinus sp. Ce-a6 TaxID=2172005 RepID=UPI00135A3E65|nr:nicotinate-nucleotide adenylyltransferase [Methylosinus sp. Ce-a6]
MIRLPPHAPGMRIGIFGGSFDPPHEGHRHVSQIALQRLRLDRLWWLATPGNPLKRTAGLPSLEQRIAAARKIACDPRIVVTGVEAEIGARYTADTLRFLHRRCSNVRFVWIMGADNLLQFHHWRDWEEIARTTPIAIVDRPGATLRAGSAKAAQHFWRARLPESAAPLLAEARPPAFVYLHAPRVAQSSTALRSAAGRA